MAFIDIDPRDIPHSEVASGLAPYDPAQAESDFYQNQRLAYADDELKTLPRIKILAHLLPSDIHLRSQALQSFDISQCDIRSDYVTCINVDEKQADALILSQASSSVLHVRLPSFNYGRAKLLLHEMTLFLHTKGLGSPLRKRVPYEPLQAINPRSFDDMLGDLWTCIVKPILRALNLITTTHTGRRQDRPRISWCLNGPLTRFPIHAVGEYPESQRVYDFIVSSYTPSMFNMAPRPLTEDHPSPPTRPILAVLGEDLMAAEGEILSVEERFGEVVEVIRAREIESAGTILRALDTCEHVHFVCHAEQEHGGSELTRSAFQLRESIEVTLADLIRVCRPGVSRRLAVLSACETAMGDVDASDEVVHLSAGMLGLGFRGVIGTTWKVKDEIARRFASIFYERAHDSSTNLPVVSKAAIALDEAVDELRKSDLNVPAWQWCTFVHFE